MASVNGNNEGGGAAGARVTKFLQWLMALPSEFSAKVVDVMSQIKKVGKEDPRRVIHALKVALSITLVSAFYYVNPLYDGATLGKGLNRGFATFLAGALGLGSYYLVHSISTEHIVEPILLGTLIYLITAGITYFRFLPQIKARYDYGLLVFNLTFCLVSVSSYRDHEVLDIALKRVISIISGGLISVSVSIFVCPIWAGGDLHNLESKNIEKLGNFLEGFGEEYFGRSEGGESNKLFIQGYKSVLTSKQVEETFVRRRRNQDYVIDWPNHNVLFLNSKLFIYFLQANFARWEPCHGRFRFRHPWQQYLKIGNLSRQCAYRIDALNGFLNSAKTPLEMRGKIPDPCIKMSTEAGKALKELAMAIHKMIPPSAANPHIAKSKIAATNLRSIMKTGLWEDTNLFEVIPVLTVASLLLHVVSCTEKLAESIQELSTLAKFKNQDSEFVPKSPQQKETPQPCCHNSGPHHVVTIN
ncbi:Aluminum-activated malate transporter 2 [Glycine soja]|uniref:Aluminum-activated malate transporter 2 isoform B n=1 Tax=Glycine soja TaxID=3848 RepID=A0A445HSB0_GLYSO|nr:Aluminum-activated malate transporter 2 isoform B [Glycine soja]